MSKKKSDYYDDPTAAPAEALPETPPEERARALLLALSEAQRHNAPITLWMINELRDLMSALANIVIAKPTHPIRNSAGQPGSVTVRKPDGTVDVIDSIEEALAYVRSLPLDVQTLPHWRSADKMLEEASTYVHSADVSPAVRQFETAVATDRDRNPRAVEVPPRDPSLDPPKPPPAPEPEPTHA